MDTVKTYEERVKSGVGNNLVYNKGGPATIINLSQNGEVESEDPQYASSMASCHFRGLNREDGGNTFSLIETDTSGTYTFHMNNVFVTDASVSIHLEVLLSKNLNLVEKYKAIKSLYKLWNFKED